MFFNRFFLAGTFIIGTSLVIISYMTGPMSASALLKVVKGERAITDIYQPISREKFNLKGPQVPIEDNTVYMSKSVFELNLKAHSEVFLNDISMDEFNTLKKVLPDLNQEAQQKWQLQANKSVKENALNFIRLLDKQDSYSGKVIKSTLLFLLKDKSKSEIEQVLKANKFYTKSSDFRIQSESIMFEFNEKGEFIRLFSR